MQFGANHVTLLVNGFQAYGHGSLQAGDDVHTTQEGGVTKWDPVTTSILFEMKKGWLL